MVTALQGFRYSSLESLSLAIESPSKENAGHDFNMLLSSISNFFPGGSIENPEHKILTEMRIYRHAIFLDEKPVQKIIIEYPVSKGGQPLDCVRGYIPSHNLHFEVNQAIDPLILNCISHLNGNELEIDTSNLSFSDPMQDKEWDSFHYEPTAYTYKAIINPIIEDYVIRIVSHTGIVSGDIVDLFGGGGSLAQSLASKLENRNFRLHVVDRNEGQIMQARKKKQIYTHLCNIVEDDPFKEINDPVIALALGGLNSNVITRDDALNVAEKTYEKLPRDGYFLVGGYTLCLLNSKDFEKIGFSLHNMSHPKNYMMKRIPQQVYVMQK